MLKLYFVDISPTSPSEVNPGLGLRFFAGPRNDLCLHRFSAPALPVRLGPSDRVPTKRLLFCWGVLNPHPQKKYSILRLSCLGTAHLESPQGQSS